MADSSDVMSNRTSTYEADMLDAVLTWWKAAVDAHQPEHVGALFTTEEGIRKIAGDPMPMRVANNATGHLWLNQPSRVHGEENHWWENLFSTHPPIQDRIRILEQM